MKRFVNSSAILATMLIVFSSAFAQMEGQQDSNERFRRWTD